MHHCDITSLQHTDARAQSQATRCKKRHIRPTSSDPPFYHSALHQAKLFQHHAWPFAAAFFDGVLDGRCEVRRRILHRESRTRIYVLLDTITNHKRQAWKVTSFVTDTNLNCTRWIFCLREANFWQKNIKTILYYTDTVLSKQLSLSDLQTNAWSRGSVRIQLLFCIILYFMITAWVLNTENLLFSLEYNLLKSSLYFQNDCCKHISNR